MTFLDTNVLIYSVDGKDQVKQAVARDIVVSLESRWTDAALLWKQRYETQFFDSLLLVAA